MQHFSCDSCGKDLQPDLDRRYVVKMDVYAAHEPAALTDDDLEDEDHLESLGQLLRDIEAGAVTPDFAPDYKQIRLDLCPDCHRKFLRDPLNKEVAKFDFSEN